MGKPEFMWKLNQYGRWEQLPMESPWTPLTDEERRQLDELLAEANRKVDDDVDD